MFTQRSPSPLNFPQDPEAISYNVRRAQSKLDYIYSTGADELERLLMVVALVAVVIAGIYIVDKFLGFVFGSEPDEVDGE